MAFPRGLRPTGIAAHRLYRMPTLLTLPPYSHPQRVVSPLTPGLTAWGSLAPTVGSTLDTAEQPLVATSCLDRLHYLRLSPNRRNVMSTAMSTPTLPTGRVISSPPEMTTLAMRLLRSARYLGDTALLTASLFSWMSLPIPPVAAASSCLLRSALGQCMPTMTCMAIKASSAPLV